ncbi:RNA polymerase subunit sigma-70 [Actinokineospora sp. NBRC 105648]|uniref:RNA polymerase subunit sigma-70 n=1 Tax=Actinokineospora sp. NBRC 105648 TaxID=3032206 RepID=UPI0024A2BEF3|nr:RNA polymerase subunit sigma-70 [Actinokineospora sp. NBRC 105648]GLZ40115.1 DNA-directed RNA polymerase sigma-70 factor [Actinokineospora sp. NBRC 105648]
MDLECHRVELTGYCYRMLASGFEAEDAVQETFLRAWRRADGFDVAKGSLRTWLYAIATNVCVDMLRSPQRRALSVGPPSEPGSPLGAPLPDTAWVWPVPDWKVLDPADAVVNKESVRLAFVAALQHLSPRQRAVLILRDVLCWRAAEVALLLDTSPHAVNSVLQRARAVLPVHQSVASRDLVVADEEQVVLNKDQVVSSRDQRVLDRYCAAFEAHDVDALVALLHEDATMAMPPFAFWMRGRAHLEVALRHATACKDAHLVQVTANGGPAFAHYAPDGTPFALITVELADGLITGTTSHLDPRLFGLFDLPMSFPAALRTHG